MGWFGYGIYSGDDTQGLHYDWLSLIGVVSNADELYDSDIIRDKTRIPKNKIHLLELNWPKIAKTLSKQIVKGSWDKNGHDEHRAIQWQMLLALFNDNNLKAPKEVFVKGCEAVRFLMGEHAGEFVKPTYRRACLKRFLEKAEKLQNLTLKA